MNKFQKHWIAGMLGALFSISFLEANPTNPTVVSGNVTFDSSVSGTLIVTSTSDLSIVNWDTFSVDGSDTLIFNLPSPSSAILNRVTGSTASQINGFIYSTATAAGTGIVYLVNNNGIDKGPVATVLTDGFLASTLDAQNSEFLAGGAMTFTDSTQQTINHNGSIVTYATDTILLGYQIIHAGNITASQGSASIGAGAEIVYNPANSERLTIVQGATGSVSTGITISSLGNIQAYQAELKADGNLYTTAIDHEGTIGVTGIVSQNGNVILDATGGYNYLNATISCQNSDSTGGTAMILGNQIELDNSAVIDCSGSENGGIIYVGGGLDGVGTPYNSQITIMTLGARITADSTLDANGGTVIVWADNTTDFYGSITSRAGRYGGDGGIVQVCGTLTFDNMGTVDVSSTYGMYGTVLGCP